MHQNLMHASVMAGITILMMLIFRKRGFWFWFILLTIPLLTELAQIPMSGRDFDVKDMFYDYVGILAVPIYYYCFAILHKEIVPVIKRYLMSKPKIKYAQTAINEYHRKLNK